MDSASADAAATLGKVSATDADVELTEVPEPEQVSIDVLFAAIGEFGFYQRRHYLVFSSVWVACAWVTLSMVFVNARPSWRYPGGDVQNSELPCDEGVEFEIVDAWHSVQGEWNLICDATWKAGFIDSAFFIGFGIGAFWLGSLADKYGRKNVLFADLLLTSVSALASAAAPSFEVYMFLRSLVGVGVGGMGVVGFIFVSEFIGTSRQGPTGVMQSTFFAVGEVLLTPFAYSCSGWRSFTVVTGLSPLMFLLLYRVVPESPRWLLAQGRVSDATSVMAIIAAGNGRELPKGQTLAATPSKAEAKASVLFQGVLLKRTLVMFYIWFASGFVYYGLALNSGNLGGSLYFNFAMGSLSEVPSLLIGVCLVDCLGRRLTLSGGMLISGISCSLCIFLPHGPATTAAAIVGKFGVTAGFAIVFVYAVELFPTVVRSLAMGMSSTSARIGGVGAPLVVLTSSIFEALPLVIFGTVAFFAGVLILTLPETVGKPLPESVEDCQAQVIRKGHVELQETA